MTRLVPVAVLCFTLAAQAAEMDRQALEERLREAGSRLALTEEQSAQARPILRSHFEAQTALLDEYGVDGSDPVDAGQFQALRRDLDANKAETSEKLAAILSAEQMAEFDRIQEERRKQVRKRFLAKGAEEIRARLALTEEQTGEVRPMLRNHFEAQLALMEKHGLEGSDQFDAGRFRSLRRDLDANKAETAGELAAILTPEQLAEFDKVQAERQKRVRKRVFAKGMEEIGARLALTEAQMAKARPILQDHLEGQLALLDKHDIDSGERPGIRKLRALRRDLDAQEGETAKKLAAILSTEQMAEYEKIQEERRERTRKARR